MISTSLASSAQVVWRIIESYGLDGDALFAQAGLDPSKRLDPRARYAEAKINRLWALALEHSGDPCIGLKAVEFWHPSNLHALGYAWLASATLKDGFERIARYVRIITDTEKLELRDEGAHYRVHIVIPEGAQRATEQDYDSVLAVLIDMCRVSYGPDLNPLRLELQRSKPPCAKRYADLFRCDVYFSADTNALLFDKDQLEAPLPSANIEIALHNDRLVANYIAGLDKSDIVLQVQKKMIEMMPSGQVYEAGIAKALNMSVRNLQRRLGHEGATFRSLLEATRRELAHEFVRDEDMPLNEITYRLGFSEPANFSRAFKRWTGFSPSQYRRERQVS